jgi:hypothetical protein
MTYYNPNYYMNNVYPYSNQYPMPMQQPQQMQPTYQMNNQPQQSLNGKIVDSEDIVKATEVPIGGYGIFPKADLSEIYIKSWNNNGTTSVITFKPMAQTQTEIKKSNEEMILQKIETLENKIDMFLAQPSVEAPQVKKEVAKNGF